LARGDFELVPFSGGLNEETVSKSWGIARECLADGLPNIFDDLARTVYGFTDGALLIPRGCSGLGIWTRGLLRQ
jgi:hypothetical protein